MGIPTPIVKECWSKLEVVIRDGARTFIESILNEEVDSYIEGMSHILDAKGNKLIRRNGYLPERKITTGVGPIPNISHAKRFSVV